MVFSSLRTNSETVRGHMAVHGVGYNWTIVTKHFFIETILSPLGAWCFMPGTTVLDCEVEVKYSCGDGITSSVRCKEIALRSVCSLRILAWHSYPATANHIGVRRI